MPVKAKRNCPINGCPNLVTQGRCPQHTTRRPDTRPPSSQRGYSTHWHQTRGRYLTQHPLCVACGQRATDVDHIISRAKGGSDEWSNLQSLCHSCHSRKTAQVDSTWGGGDGRDKSVEVFLKYRRRLMAST